MIEFLPVVLGAGYSVFGPIVRHHPTLAFHNALFTYLPPDEVTLAQNNWPEGRRVQEIGEDRIAGWVATIAVLIAAFFVSGVIAAIGLTVAWFLIKAVTIKLRFMDDAGHGAEIIVVEKSPEARARFPSYRLDEVWRMLDDPRRDGEEAWDVLEDLDRVKWISKIMVWLAR